MKTCDEMTRDVLARVRAYEAQEPLRRKKRLLKRLIVLMMAGVLLCACGIWYAMPVKMIPKVFPSSSPVFHAQRSVFDLSDILSGCNGQINTIVFVGIIKTIRTYDISWKNDLSEEEGPFEESLLTVEITRTYGTHLPKDKTITILYPYPLATEEADAATLMEGQEYVFTNCWNIDEAYAAYCNKLDPSGSWGKDPMLSKADVVSGAVWCSIYPIENETVLIYRDYFADMPDVIAQAQPAREIQSTAMPRLSEAHKDAIIALRYDVFENAFIQLLEKYSRK